MFPSVSRRTLQRWIHGLVQNGQICGPMDKPGPGTTSVHLPSRRFAETFRRKSSFRRTAGTSSPTSSNHRFGANQWVISANSSPPTSRARRSTSPSPAPAAPPDRRHRPIAAAGRHHGRAILDRLLIDLSWASSHLEGNTYTRLDTLALIENGQAAVGKAEVETQMILNHKGAIELIFENIDEVGFNRYTLLGLHSALSENLLPNPADEGRLRQHVVEIGRSVYRPLGVPGADRGAARPVARQGERRIPDPFEQSFFVMVHLPYLQPFADVNKRTSRLAANIPLIRANLCPLTFVDVPEGAYSRAILGVYEMTRTELLRDLYLWAYERSTREYLAIRQEMVEPDPLRLAYRSLIKGTVREVVQSPDQDPLLLIRRAVAGGAGCRPRERAGADQRGAETHPRWRARPLRAATVRAGRLAGEAGAAVSRAGGGGGAGRFRSCSSPAARKARPAASSSRQLIRASTGRDSSW